MARLNQPEIFLFHGEMLAFKEVCISFLMGHIHIGTVLSHLSYDITKICRYTKQMLVIVLTALDRSASAAMPRCFMVLNEK